MVRGFFMELKIYAEKSWKKWFNRQTRNQYMRDVKIDEYPNGIIVNEKLRGFGVFDKNYEFVKSSRQVRKNNGQFIPNFKHTDIPYVDEDVVFVGNVYPQFGHFLLEHLNRAYAALDKKYQKMKFVLINNKSVEPVPEYMLVFLELLGIPRKNILVLDRTTQFKNVYVPVQGFNIPIYSSKAFGETFAKMAKSVKDNEKVYDKVYVSRAKLNTRKTYGEEKVQKIFERNGFKVIYPETMSLKEQIATIKDCNFLAGCAGTALHMALFMKAGGTVIQIKRNKIYDDNAPTQWLLNETCGLNSVFINSSVERVKTGHGFNMPQIIGVNENMRDFFKDFGFKTNDKDFEVDDIARQEYDTALSKYQGEHGTKIVEFIKHKIVRISSCFIPGRYNRSVYRRWLKNKLGIV
jgi:capsular polysaccharide biosynthesis protein